MAEEDQKMGGRKPFENAAMVGFRQKVLFRVLDEVGSGARGGENRGKESEVVRDEAVHMPN